MLLQVTMKEESLGLREVKLKDAPTYKRILLQVLKFEGGYVNHPADKGGATNKGVTQKTYNSFRSRSKLPRMDVKYITQEEVEQIYYEFWRGASCDKINESHPLTAAAHFDFAINSGPKQAAKVLQRCCKAKPVDGIIGRITLGAVFACDDFTLSNSILDARQKFFQSLVDRNETQRVFLRGWTRRVTHLRKLINEWSRDSKQ
jgi:lysozyme family protein